MPPLPHRIRRLTLRARADSQSQALALRKEVRGQLDTALLGAMERAFDGLGAPDALIHVPKVHVRVRISSTDELAGELERCLEQELRRHLSTLAATTANPFLQPGSPGAKRPGRAGFAGGASAETDAPDGEAPASLLPRARMLIHYLETGSLPWPLAQVDPAVALSELRDAAGGAPSEVLAQLSGEPGSLPAQVAFWFRWLQLRPEASWPALARVADPPLNGQGAQLAELLGALSGERAGALSRYARLQLAAVALARARRPGGPADAEALASVVLHVLGGLETINGVEQLAGTSAGMTSHGGAASGAGASSPDGRRSSSGRAASEAGNAASGDDSQARASGGRGKDRPRVGTPEEGGAASNGSRAGPSASTGSDGAEAKASAPSQDRKAPPEGARLRAAAALASRLPEPAAGVFQAWLAAPGGPPHVAAPDAPRPSQPRPEPLSAMPPGDARAAAFGQRVHHAGLVLLHPFLPRLFESTALKEKGNPVLAVGALPRAAALLHLLATGEEAVFELELDFIKVLLGLPPGAPLPVSEGLLLASDREEVEALLSAVIGHWSVLKSTSVKGLRGSFLRRPGLLREEEQGFRLQVEAAPFDMLLGQLPWGMGTVKLPWMKKAIFTEWQAP